MTKKISIGKYNALFATAEEGLQNSWVDLGIPLDGSTIDGILKNNDEIQNRASGGVLPPSYYLYKKHANYIVDKILKELDVEVEE